MWLVKLCIYTAVLSLFFFLKLFIQRLKGATEANNDYKNGSGFFFLESGISLHNMIMMLLDILKCTETRQGQTPLGLCTSNVYSENNKK